MGLIFQGSRRQKFYINYKRCDFSVHEDKDYNYKRCDLSFRVEEDKVYINYKRCDFSVHEDKDYNYKDVTYLSGLKKTKFI